MNMHKTFARLALLLPIFLSSCDRFLQIVPVGDVIPESETEYRATLNSGYGSSPSQMLVNLRGLVYDHQSDPFGLNLDAYDLYKTIHTWADNDNNSGRSEQYPYYSFYKGIFYANSVILADPVSVKKDAKDDTFDQIRSEAYALRAYNYFCLLNLYGPKWSNETASTKVAPINNTIDTEQKFPAATLGALYDQVLRDLAEAVRLSQVPRYKDVRYRYRFSGEAVLALASRVHLYRGEWKESLDFASKALTVDDKLTDLNALGKEGFLPTDYRSEEDIVNFTPQQVTDISSFLSIQEPFLKLYPEGDLRRSKYYALPSAEAGTTYATMAKVGRASMNVTIRRAEVYLNAAEAAVRLGETESARKYLSELLKNRMTPNAFSTEKARIDALSAQALVDEILKQRRLELAGEGHDWFDFKRTTQPELKKVVRGETYTLPAGDPRYVISLPREARDNNPLL